LSREIKRLISAYLEKTGDPSLIDFKLHDFGFRGVSSLESATIGGMAHLVNFKGTDTMAALVGAERYYDCPNAGFSIPAAEHSTITSWGRDNEEKAYENMLDQFPTGLVAVVSDSYNIFNACREIWGNKLKAKILERNGTVVIRPDSGNPTEVVLDVLNCLGEAFGYNTVKGFKVLDPHIRVIQGDGIDHAMVSAILSKMKMMGWSADNIAFGSGGGLLQKMNRDTLRFAFKCSNITIDGKDQEVYKDPITDQGKVSKKGRLKLVDIGNGLETVDAFKDYGVQDELVEVFRDGEILKKYTLDEIRTRATV
jgi:nicotinamide phosphoribosyltransferase